MYKSTLLTRLKFTVCKLTYLVTSFSTEVMTFDYQAIISEIDSHWFLHIPDPLQNQPTLIKCLLFSVSVWEHVYMYGVFVVLYPTNGRIIRIDWPAIVLGVKRRCYLAWQFHPVKFVEIRLVEKKKSLPYIYFVLQLVFLSFSLSF